MNPERDGSPPKPRRFGVVVVHGVQPHPRYSLQDEFAAALCRELNGRDKNAGRGEGWVADVRMSRRTEQSLQPLPFASRVHRDGGAAEYDITEAYWSPLDKHRTTARSVLSWLLRTLFVPANTTAQLHASARKVMFDFAFVGIAVATAVVALIAAVLFGLESVAAVLVAAGGQTPQAALPLVVLLNPVTMAAIVKLPTLALLAAGWIGAFLLWQAAKAAIRMWRQRALLGALREQRDSRSAVIAVLVVVGGALLAWACFGSMDGSVPLRGAALGFVLSTGALELARAIFVSFIVNFFGDVQIYTTQDQNSAFYEIRQRILGLAVTVIAEMLSDRPLYDKEPYERVFVFAHSLGSSIAMDAILQLHQLHTEKMVSRDEWGRLRAFVTFGTALEKTKYFFDVLNPSPTAAFEQWRDDRYGLVYTDDHSVLGGKQNAPIFWSNYWYFQDPIANEIRSFRSFLEPGDDVEHAQALRSAAGRDAAADITGPGQRAEGQPVCRNERGRMSINSPFHLVLHGDYLADPWFWQSDPARDHLGALDILTSGEAGVVQGAAPRPARKRYRIVGPMEAGTRRTLDSL